jgi:YVTN family beta-propeller protein
MLANLNIITIIRSVFIGFCPGTHLSNTLTPKNRAYKHVLQAETHQLNYSGYDFGSKIVPKPFDLSAMVFDPHTNKLFVIKNSNNSVYVFTVFLGGSLKPEGKFAIRPCPVICDITPRQGIAVDPDTNMVYVANPDNNSVSVISGIAPHAIIENISFLLGKADSKPDAIAVNPKTHTVYVSDIFNGFVYVINDKCIIEPKQCHITLVKVSPARDSSVAPMGIAVDSNRNMVYVTNPDNDTVSVIDGKTNSLSVGVNFKIDPPYSGYVNCNGISINSNTSMMLDLGSLTCEAKANSVFPSPFSYWSVFPPIWFDSWSGNLVSPDSVNDHIITLRPTHFGRLDANFNVLSDAYITTILAIAIPAAGGLLYRPFKTWFGQMRRGKNLIKYRNLIDDTSKIANRDKKKTIFNFLKR